MEEQDQEYFGSRRDQHWRESPRRGSSVGYAMDRGREAYRRHQQGQYDESYGGYGEEDYDPDYDSQRFEQYRSRSAGHPPQRDEALHWRDSRMAYQSAQQETRRAQQESWLEPLQQPPPPQHPRFPSMTSAGLETSLGPPLKRSTKKQTKTLEKESSSSSAVSSSSTAASRVTTESERQAAHEIERLVTLYSFHIGCIRFRLVQRLLWHFCWHSLACPFHRSKLEPQTTWPKSNSGVPNSGSLSPHSLVALPVSLPPALQTGRVLPFCTASDCWVQTAPCLVGFSQRVSH